MSKNKNNPILGEIEHLPDNYGIGGFIPSEFKLDDEIRKSNPLVSYKDDVDEVEETNIHAKADMQLEHDFDKARGNLKDVLDNTSTILTDAIVLAQSSDSPRAFEVVASLMKTIADVNRDLLKLHEQREDIKGKRNGGQPAAPVQNTQNNYFHGSPAELNRMLQKDQS